MKLFYSISLLLAISLNLLITIGFIAKYAIQYDYYTNVLCEDKDEKVNECQGMCHLSSELSYQNLDTEQEQTTQFNYNFTPLFIQNFAPSETCICDEKATFTSPNNRILVTHPKDIDHPPELV
ncbi:MAG: hypothetical protein KJP21_08710 [Bacteroidia bacterium]|nr:hypothetical protein [Bacteroidia bacterium]NNJ56429.1 hypothetical protein [Bacteroidia bacterium]